MNTVATLRVADWATIVNKLVALGMPWNKAVWHVANAYGLNHFEVKAVGRLTKPEEK